MHSSLGLKGDDFIHVFRSYLSLKRTWRTDLADSGQEIICMSTPSAGCFAKMLEFVRCLWSWQVGPPDSS